MNMHTPKIRLPDGALPTLATVLSALEQRDDISPTRRRDLRSAVTRMAALLQEEPGNILLDLRDLRPRVNAINPVAAGISAKSLANIRSDFLAAVKASGIRPIVTRKVGLTEPWRGLTRRLATKRKRFGISRLAHYASGLGLEPRAIDDRVIEQFMHAIREGSLHRKPNELHRMTAVIWNESATALPDLNLQIVSVPSYRASPRRIDWSALPANFGKDVEDHLTWCGDKDNLNEDARPRPLGPATVRLRRNQIHAAVSALVESGAAAETIRSLSDLLNKENFKRIARRRRELAGGQENQFNTDLLKALIQIGREWIKLDVAVLTELKRVARKLPGPLAGLTAKNKRFLRQFDDPAVLARLDALPARLWAEVRRDARLNSRTLAKAQCAIGVALLTYIPIRIQNLAALKFGVHVFLRDEAGAKSVLELVGDEVKNGQPLAFDIAPHLVEMLIEYRDRIAPKVIGRKPDLLFGNADGSQKLRKSLSDLISRTVRKYIGVELTPHQFRHLAAKRLLDHAPGAHETVRQLLGHLSLKTSTTYYGGTDTRRAGAYYQGILEPPAPVEPHKPRPRSRTTPPPLDETK
jgi:integrase